MIMTMTKPHALTLTASVHARWGHRVDDLIHSHAWTVEATVASSIDRDMVFPADDLEDILLGAVEPWQGHYLTDTDLGPWKRLEPLLWDREPTVEEIARRLWDIIAPQVPELREVALVESTEFDRCRTVRLTA